VGVGREGACANEKYLIERHSNIENKLSYYSLSCLASERHSEVRHLKERHLTERERDLRERH